ncbi:hypothetical protein KC340_g129 [Hortaea werneckii]|nr:hypothetical protein KC340_g129 [Hortaea werneckii]
MLSKTPPALSHEQPLNIVLSFDNNAFIPRHTRQDSRCGVRAFVKREWRNVLPNAPGEKSMACGWGLRYDEYERSDTDPGWLMRDFQQVCGVGCDKLQSAGLVRLV